MDHDAVIVDLEEKIEALEDRVQELEAENKELQGELEAARTEAEYSDGWRRRAEDRLESLTSDVHYSVEQAIDLLNSAVMELES